MATNRRQQIQLSPDEQTAFFRERKKASLATIDKDGFPHVVAMNYFATDGAFYMTSYGKAQKVLNIRRNPKVALMIEAGDEYAELRTARLPASLLDRAPHVEDRDGQAVWVCDGKVWGRWDGKPPATGSARPIKALYNAFDRAGIHDPSARRPAVAELRLADMDRDGVATQVIFGPIFQISTDDPVLRTACYCVYNDWLLDFCKAAPDRLIGLPMLPETPEGALAELERVRAKGGVRQVNLMIANVSPKLDDPAWEPLWQALEESGIILSWHITVFVGKPGDRVAGKAASVFENTKFFLANFLEPFVDLFAWGILERHPRLRMVMAEAGTGWLPWLVQELDYRHWRLWEAKEFWADKGGGALETKPSELFKRQIYATFQEDHVAMSLIPFFGDGHLLWASDYPHPDSVWPNSREAIERQMRHLSPEMRRHLTHDNAAALYGLGGASADRPMVAIVAAAL